jgi:hypothetical protein
MAASYEHGNELTYCKKANNFLTSLAISVFSRRILLFRVIMRLVVSLEYLQIRC